MRSVFVGFVTVVAALAILYMRAQADSPEVATGIEPPGNARKVESPGSTSATIMCVDRACSYSYPFITMGKSGVASVTVAPDTTVPQFFSPTTGDAALDRAIRICTKHASRWGWIVGRTPDQTIVFDAEYADTCSIVLSRWEASEAASAYAAKVKQDAEDKRFLETFTKGK